MEKNDKTEPANQPAKPPEKKDQTYRSVRGGVIAIVSSDELEIREHGENIVCKYTEKDNKLRVVVSALGTTRAMYFNITPNGLVGEQGEIYYDPSNKDAERAAMAATTMPSCQNNLRQISGTKDQYALDHNNKGPSSFSDLVPIYLKKTPVCPAGGTYIIGPLGHDAQCTIAGHTI